MKITLKQDAKPVKYQTYRLNPRVKEKVKRKLDKILAIGLIVPVDETEWINPIIIQDNKYPRILGCVLIIEVSTILVYMTHSPFLSAMKFWTMLRAMKLSILLMVFSRYHHLRIVEKYHKKTKFTTEWGSYAYNATLFGLNNVPTALSWILIATLWEYIHKFLDV